MKAHDLYPDLCPLCYRTEDDHHPSCPNTCGDDSPEMRAFWEGVHAKKAGEPVPARASRYFVFGYRFAEHAEQCEQNGINVLPDFPPKL